MGFSELLFPGAEVCVWALALVDNSLPFVSPTGAADVLLLEAVKAEQLEFVLGAGAAVPGGELALAEATRYLILKMVDSCCLR